MDDSRAVWEHAQGAVCRPRAAVWHQHIAAHVVETLATRDEVVAIRRHIAAELRHEAKKGTRPKEGVHPESHLTTFSDSGSVAD